MNRELFQQAKELFEAGNFSGAVQKFRTLYDNDKHNAELAYYLGLTLLKQDQYDQALKFLEQAQKMNDSDYRIYEALGEAYGMKAQRAGSVKGALTMPKVKKSFLKAIELNSEALSAREGLFMFYLFVPGVAGGDEKKAESLIAEIKALNEARGYLARGVFERKKKNETQANEAFLKAAENGQDDADVQMKAGHFFLNNNQTEKALELFERYIALKPNDAAGYSAKGQALLQKDDAAGAVKLFDRALQQNSAYFPARFQRAKALHRMNRTLEAESDLKEIIRRHPKSPQAMQAKQLLIEFKG